MKEELKRKGTNSLSSSTDVFTVSDLFFRSRTGSRTDKDVASTVTLGDDRMEADALFRILHGPGRH